MAPSVSLITETESPVPMGKISDLKLEPSIEFEPSCSRCTNGNKVTVVFEHDTYVFHSQWLHDARCDDGASRNAISAICQQPAELVTVDTVQISGMGASATLDVNWKNGVSSQFPLPWLQVMAPLVANHVAHTYNKLATTMTNVGWTATSLQIPEISYHDLFDENIEASRLNATMLSVLDKILDPSAAGIVKIIDLPSPNFEDEHKHVNNLNTKVLKRLFGSVFIHPVRGPDQTFNVSSHAHDATRKVGVPNYDTSQVLLPHTDHAFYDNPIQVQGFYGLEGTSENTFVSVLACLETLKAESPEAYHYLCNSPMAVGRMSRFYGDAILQATVDTPITMQPGYPNQFKRIRWHPNLTGALLAPYEEYKAARNAHRLFEEIMRRDTHQWKTILKPGDYYVWDNFRIMHGREQVIEVPRTGVGQTVPESVVHDRYRALANAHLKNVIGEDWLVHMPMTQLRQMVNIVRNG